MSECACAQAELRCSDDFCAMNMVVVQEVSRDWNEKTMKVGDIHVMSQLCKIKETH